MEGVEGRRSGREEGVRVEDGGGVGKVMNMGGGRRRCLELGVQAGLHHQVAAGIGVMIIGLSGSSWEVVEVALGEQVVMVGGRWRRLWADGERDEVGVHVLEAALQRSLHCCCLLLYILSHKYIYIYPPYRRQFLLLSESKATKDDDGVGGEPGARNGNGR